MGAGRVPELGAIMQRQMQRKREIGGKIRARRAVSSLLYLERL
jgi:hypothetical protein